MTEGGISGRYAHRCTKESRFSGRDARRAPADEGASPRRDGAGEGGGGAGVGSPMTRQAANTSLVAIGVAAVVAFFLPFLDLGGLIQASGFDVLVGDGASWTLRLALLGLPVGGLALIVAGATGSPRARLAALAFGGGVYGYLGVQLVRAFFATTGVGLWLTLLAAAAALGVALFTKSRD